MKKVLIIIFVLFVNVIPIDAFELSDYWQIKMTLRDYDRALSAQDTERIKTFYDENYKSSDGFSLDDLVQMLEKSYKAYGKMNQKTKINSITSLNNYAVVQLSDKTSAVIYPNKIKNKAKAGKLEGRGVYNLYFKKNNDKWKIFYDEVVAETTSLKYGVANKIPMELDTPILIHEGEQYNLSLKMNKPDDIIALASLSNEEIKYPTPETKEKFRKFPSTGELERLVKANKNNKGEYAIASVGFTKVSVNEAETRARIEIIGMAYIMKRINMIALKENNEK